MAVDARAAGIEPRWSVPGDRTGKKGTPSACAVRNRRGIVAWTRGRCGDGPGCIFHACATRSPERRSEHLAGQADPARRPPSRVRHPDRFAQDLPPPLLHRPGQRLPRRPRPRQHQRRPHQRRPRHRGPAHARRRADHRQPPLPRQLGLHGPGRRRPHRRVKDTLRAPQPGSWKTSELESCDEPVPAGGADRSPHAAAPGRTSAQPAALPVQKAGRIGHPARQARTRLRSDIFPRPPSHPPHRPPA